MNLKRILAAVGLVGIVLGIAVWLVLHGSEPDQLNGKPPPTSLAFQRTVLAPPPTTAADDGPSLPALPGFDLPCMTQAKNGQLLLDMLGGVAPVPKPTPATIEPYLHLQNRSAASLLAAWQATGSSEYLREAATRFEYDPQVQLAVLASGEFSNDRAKWIALFKQSSSDNPLANYLAAQADFGQNQTDQAIAEMMVASSRQRVEDYIAAYSQECEKLFLATGVSPTDAKARGFAAAYLSMQPCVETLADVAQTARSAQAAYGTDDAAAAQKLAQAIVMLGRQMNTPGAGRLLAMQTAGIDIEQTLLHQLPPDEPLDWLGQSPATRLAELQQQKEQIEAIQAAYTSVLPRLDDADFAEYLDRVKENGELEAMKWLATRKQNP